MSQQPKVVLSIAGFDPSSGAGVTADIKTAAAHGCFAVCCPTALTVQSTLGVQAVEPLTPELVERTLVALAEDFDISAVRIGMLGSAPLASAVAGFLRRTALPNVVLDPVIRSSSGAALLDAAGCEVLRTELLPLASVVTPNIAEAEALTGISIRTGADQSRAAVQLLQLGTRGAVVTGGHLSEARDVLAWQDDAGIHEEVFTGTILDSHNTHGTGCAFAASLACGLANRNSLPASVRAAKAYVRSAIESAPGLGHGRGPLNLL